MYTQMAQQKRLPGMEMEEATSLNSGTTIQQAIPAGKFSTNCKTDPDALQTTAKLLLENKEATHPQSCHLLRSLVSLAGTAEP